MKHDIETISPHTSPLLPAIIPVRPNANALPLCPQSFLRRPVLYPFGLCLALLGFQQVSGIDTVIFYTVEIFMAANGSVDEYLATILIGVVQLVRAPSRQGAGTIPSSHVRGGKTSANNLHAAFSRFLSR